MNTIIQKMNNTKIDELKLDIIELVSKSPSEKFSVDKIKKLLIENGLKTNYATVYRKVDSLTSQSILMKSMYGMTSEIKINLESDNTLSLLSFIENKRTKTFIEKLKGSIKISLNEIKTEINDIIEIKCVIIFGSFAKDKQRADSDLDILIIFEPSKLIKNKNYEEDIKSSIKSILKTSELRGGVQINPIIVSSEENIEMLSSSENNVGKEALINHIIIKGDLEYWREVAKCCRKLN
jgi:predicted nucleotidyltransferase